MKRRFAQTCWRGRSRSSAIEPDQLKSRGIVAKIIVAATLIGLLAVGGLYGCEATTRRHVAANLNIPALPPSATKVACVDSGLWTDFVERCAFEVDPADFTRLLAGYHFALLPVCSQMRTGGACVERLPMSHDYCCGAAIGGNFRVAAVFSASPAEFEHGGSVTVVTDASRRHVFIDIYIE
jgi:hypothetical protein